MKIFDLEERTFKFAKRIREFVRKLPKNMINLEDGSQLIRSSGSVGANYIEANEALSKKDFLNPDFAIAKSALRAATPQRVAASGVNPATAAEGKFCKAFF